MDSKTRSPVDRDAVVLTIENGMTVFFKKIRPQ